MPPPAVAHSSVRTIRGIRVMTIVGELDLLSAARLSPDFNDVIRSDAPGLVIDLTGLTFIDSTGLAVLVNAKRRLDRRDRPLALVCGPTGVRRTIEMTRLDRMLDLHEGLDAALAAIAPGAA